MKKNKDVLEKNLKEHHMYTFQTSKNEKTVIIGRETMGFAIIGLQSSTSLKQHLKRWHFILYDIWSF